MRGDDSPMGSVSVRAVVLLLVPVALGAGPVIVRPADLEREAEKAPPAVAALYRALARPLDEVATPGAGPKQVPPRPEWADALRLGDLHLDTYPHDQAVRADVARLRLRHAAHLLQARDYPAARTELARVEPRLLPGADDKKRFHEVRQGLQAVAEA